jgi:hypothetical protein
VASAIEHRFQQRSSADVERADALGRVNLVAGNRQQITADFVYVQRNLARPDCIRVEIDVRFGGDFPISSTGCRTPVSLLAVMMVISFVVGRKSA